jgi:hypothetical protein
MSAFGGKADIELITRELRFAEVANLIGSGIEGSSFSATFHRLGWKRSHRMSFCPT